MFGKEDTKRLEKKIDEIAEKLEIVLDRQNSQYTDIMMRIKEVEDEIQENSESSSSDGRDIEELYEDVKEDIIEVGKASTSYIQRMESIGYAKAAHIMDLLEERGVIGTGNGAKPREVLIKPEEE